EADTSIRTPDLDAAPRLIAVEIEQRAIAGTDGLAIDLNGKAGVATAFAQEPALARRPAHVESPTLQLKPSLQIRATVTTFDLRRTFGSEAQAHALSVGVDMVDDDGLRLQRQACVDRQTE